MTPATPLLALEGIEKSYGAVRALSGIDLHIERGEVLALCGDNGAGKSSLVKVLSGAHAPDAGRVLLEGKEVLLASPQDALRLGIATIYQDLAVAPRLSIAENVFLGAELTFRPFGLPIALLDRRRMATEARGYLARLGIAIGDMRRPVERLSGGQRQAVAISRALRWDARIIIMDEPTAALGVKETALVLDLIRALHAEGRTVLLVSHSMPDVAAVATRIAILRAGRKVFDGMVARRTPADLAALVMAARP